MTCRCIGALKRGSRDGALAGDASVNATKALVPARRVRSILFVEYASDWTGPAKSLSLLLAGLRRRNFQIAVVAPRDSHTAHRYRSEGYRVCTVQSLTKRHLPSLLAILRAEQPDLVYVNNLSGATRLTYLAARLLRLPIAVHVRSMAWRTNWLKAFYLRDVDAVICVSQAAAEPLKRFVRTERLHVVYNGIEVCAESKRSDEKNDKSCLESRGRNDRTCSIAVVAHLTSRKNQMAAIEAIQTLRESSVPARLMLLGSLDREPDYVSSLVARIETLGLSDRVEVLGFKEDVQGILSGVDILLHTALEDPHPRAVLEAMAVGIPVVALNVDGVSETVVNGDTGLLVDPDGGDLAEALRLLIEDPELRIRMGAAGRERAETCFSADSTTEGVADVIQRILLTPSAV